MIEPVARHVEQAQHTARRAPAPFEFRQGDARHLDVEDDGIEVVLLMGPLYHLGADGRRRALSEAARVLRPGGVLVAAAISRFASLLDGLRRGWLGDAQFSAIIEQDLATGEHRNPDPVGRPHWFTTAWFRGQRSWTPRWRLPGSPSIASSLWRVRCGCSAISSSGGLTRRNATDSWTPSGAVESEPSMLGTSAHLLATARTRADGQTCGRGST